MANYKSKLLHPNWQKKRLSILNRDEFMCRFCLSNEKTLHVHHINYINYNEPWNCDDDELITLCGQCHLEEDVGKKELKKEIDNLIRKNISSSEILEHLRELTLYIDTMSFEHKKFLI